MRELQQQLHTAKEQAAIVTCYGCTPLTLSLLTIYSLCLPACTVLTVPHVAKEQAAAERGDPNPGPNHNPNSNQAAAEETARLEAALKQARRESQEEFFAMHKAWCTEGNGKDDADSPACKRWREWMGKTEL